MTLSVFREYIENDLRFSAVVIAEVYAIVKEVRKNDLFKMQAKLRIK